MRQWMRLWLDRNASQTRRILIEDETHTAAELGVDLTVDRLLMHILEEMVRQDPTLEKSLSKGDLDTRRRSLLNIKIDAIGQLLEFASRLVETARQKRRLDQALVWWKQAREGLYENHQPREQLEPKDSSRGAKLRRQIQRLYELGKNFSDDTTFGRELHDFWPSVIDADSSRPKVVLGDAKYVHALRRMLNLSDRKLGLKRFRRHRNLPEQWILKNPERVLQLLIDKAKEAVDSRGQ